MALNRILNDFYKKNLNPGFLKKIEKFKVTKSHTIIFFSVCLILPVIFIPIFNLTSKINHNNKSHLNGVVKSKDFSNITNFLISKLKSPYGEIKYSIQTNDSIEKILKNFNIKKQDINTISLMLKRKKLTNIYFGRELSLIFKRIENGKKTLVNLIYPISNVRSIEIRKVDEKFIVKENILKLNRKEVVVRKEIINNLYSSAVKAKVEPNIIIEFARIFGFEVDFQRDIRKGDWFEILYEKFIDDNNKVRDTGKIIYASMFVNGEEINLYNFKTKKNDDYFDIKGKSITKSLMKTPINGARLSSAFGMRKHPILGYNKMHKGTDFAAPSGTPIMASGTGTVTRARWCGGGGNCVKIKHNSTYETVYAHLKNFAKGIKEGKKVKQGQIIGYVGSTGMSTGPHLHYEVIVNGKKVNSQRLKLPSGKILRGNEREKFELERIKIDLKISELRS